MITGAERFSEIVEGVVVTSLQIPLPDDCNCGYRCGTADAGVQSNWACGYGWFNRRVDCSCGCESTAVAVIVCVNPLVNAFKMVLSFGSAGFNCSCCLSLSLLFIWAADLVDHVRQGFCDIDATFALGALGRDQCKQKAVSSLAPLSFFTH